MWVTQQAQRRDADTSEDRGVSRTLSTHVTIEMPAGSHAVDSLLSASCLCVELLALSRDARRALPIAAAPLEQGPPLFLIRPRCLRRLQEVQHRLDEAPRLVAMREVSGMR